MAPLDRSKRRPARRRFRWPNWAVIFCALWTHCGRERKFAAEYVHLTKRLNQLRKQERKGRRTPARNRRNLPMTTQGCIRATHFGQDDSLEFFSLHDHILIRKISPISSMYVHDCAGQPLDWT